MKLKKLLIAAVVSVCFIKLITVIGAIIIDEAKITGITPAELIFNGKKILVIFSDYFRDIYDGTIAENDPMWKLKVSMGNSIYYDAIKKIVEVFYLTFETSHSRLLSMSSSLKNAIFAPFLVVFLDTDETIPQSFTCCLSVYFLASLSKSDIISDILSVLRDSMHRL